jgi:SAM-dependent methyltransferase
MEPAYCDPSNYLEVNRANWEARVPIHVQGYALEKFRCDPQHLSRVVRFDTARLPSVKGLRGIHLQCHLGTDTVSLSRLGAEMVGLDFSPAALAAARKFSAEAGASIRWVESDVYGAVARLEAAQLPLRYDFVYTGIGALCWLPDIDRWAATASALLRPGGFLFIREGHPMLWSVGETRTDGAIEIAYDYFEGRGIAFEESQTYAGPGTVTSPRTISFNHGLAEIFNALRAHHLEWELFEEHDSVPWNPLGDEFREIGDTGEWQLRDNPRRLAASYTLLARKTAPPPDN